MVSMFYLVLRSRTVLIKKEEQVHMEIHIYE